MGNTKTIIYLRICRYWSVCRKGIFLIFFLSLFIISCKSSRTIIKEPIKAYGADYIFEKLKENELHYDWLSAKFSLDLVMDKKKTSFNGQIRMRKDSIIWISMSPALGIEMARMIISNDSIKFINRLNKTYFKGDYKIANKFLKSNVDFDVIQAILLGNDLTFYENGKFRATYDSKSYHLVTANRQKLKKYLKTEEDAERIFIQNIFLDPETFKITAMRIKDIKLENKKLEAEYTDFELLGNQLFPTHIIYSISAETPVQIDLNYSKIELDNELSFPFKISSKYSRIE
jgi:hypothetical protein